MEALILKAALADPAVLSVMVGALLAVGSIIMAALTLRSTTARDALLMSQNAQVLLETANKSTVDMLERRVALLEDQNKELRIKQDECAKDKDKMREENTELRDRNYELMERILGLTETVNQHRNNPIPPRPQNRQQHKP